MPASLREDRKICHLSVRGTSHKMIGRMLLVEKMWSLFLNSLVIIEEITWIICLSHINSNLWMLLPHWHLFDWGALPLVWSLNLLWVMSWGQVAGCPLLCCLCEQSHFNPDTVWSSYGKHSNQSILKAQVYVRRWLSFHFFSTCGYRIQYGNTVVGNCRKFKVLCSPHWMKGIIPHWMKGIIIPPINRIGEGGMWCLQMTLTIIIVFSHLRFLQISGQTTHRIELKLCGDLLHGNAFRITGPLWGETIGQWWIPITKASGCIYYGTLQTW